MTFQAHPVVLCLVVLTLCGCPQTPEQETTLENPYRGQQVEIAAPSDPRLCELIDIDVIEWEAQYETEAQCAASPEQGSRVVEFFTWEQTDLFSRKLWPAPAEFRDQERFLPTDYFSGLRKTLFSPQGESLIVPLSTPVLMIYYRADLLEAAGLEPPETWEQYDQLCQTVDQWAEGLSVVEPLNEQTAGALFLARAMPVVKHAGHFSVFFDIYEGKPLIDHRGFRREYDRFTQHVSHLAKESFDLSPRQARQAVMEGKAAMAIGWEYQSVVDSPAIAESIPNYDETLLANIKVARLPGSLECYNMSEDRFEQTRTGQVQRVELFGISGTAVAVVGGEDELPSASVEWLLLDALVGTNFSSGLFSGWNGLSRLQQLDEGASWLGQSTAVGLRQPVHQVNTQALQASETILLLPVPGRQQYLESLNAAVTDALKSGVEYTEDSHPLQAVAQQWDAIAEQLGRPKLIQTYRKMIGLKSL